LYDQVLIEHLRASDDPYPYLRGQISEIGYPVARVPFLQPRRKRGFSKNNFYTLFDMAMLGFTNHTKVPLRLATMVGFAMSVACLVISLIYLIYKLLNWNNFVLGTAPIVVGLFFIGSVQLFFIGVLGEYIGAVHTKVTKRPLVVERERINFS
jgi:polyisoprenyl-phosphate glycosyltransferase